MPLCLLLVQWCRGGGGDAPRDPPAAHADLRPEIYLGCTWGMPCAFCLLSGAEAGVGMPPGTLLRHVSADICEGEDWRDEGWGEKLVRMGYRGDRPSIWVLQVGQRAVIDSCKKDRTVQCSSLDRFR